MQPTSLSWIFRVRACSQFMKIPTDTRIGLIQNESEETIALIRDLVESNIQQENTIILVTVPVCGESIFCCPSMSKIERQKQMI